MAIRLLIFTAFILAFVFSSCSKNRESFVEISVPVRIGLYNGEASMVQIVADKLGFIEGEGLTNVEINYFPTGRDGFKALVNKEVDFANSTEFVNMKNAFQTNSFSILASTGEGNINGFIGKKSHGIKKTLDIKGKTIGTSLGTATEFYAGVFAVQNGVLLKDFDLVDVPFQKRGEALKSGEIDGLFTWEPFLYNMTREYKGEFFYSPVPVGFHFYFTFSVDKEFHHKNPEVSKRLLSAFIKAEQWIENNPEKFKKLVQETFQYDSRYTDYTLGKHSFAVGLPYYLKTLMEIEGDWLVENKIVQKKKVDFHKIFDREVLRSIQKERVTLQD
ncbi:MAG: ABC transporter substrate-binding protein [Campylobacterales bacterium]|nr:ABC transporter substrate-binding protein [Campylobacterales bacterium]